MIDGSTRVRAAIRPPIRPASSNNPNNMKLFATGGQVGRKSGKSIVLAKRAKLLPVYFQGRIFSPSGPLRFLSGFTKSSRETPSHMTSDAMTSADE